MNLLDPKFSLIGNDCAEDHSTAPGLQETSELTAWGRAPRRGRTYTLHAQILGSEVKARGSRRRGGITRHVPPLRSQDAAQG